MVHPTAKWSADFERRCTAVHPHLNEDFSPLASFPKSRSAFSSAKQVAELAGVSRSAVSRTFTPGASVSEETRQRVLSAAEQLGYHVNHLARGLTQQSTGIVCLIVADSDTPYQARMLRALIQSLREAGKVAMVLDTSGPSEHVAQALRQTLNYRADATVVLSGTPPEALVRICLENGQKLILINRNDPLLGPYNIGIDSDAAADLALHALMRAGCRRPALVTSAAGTPSLLDRERAFIGGAAKLGLEVVVWRGGRTNYRAGADGARSLLAGARRPDAAFCVTDLIACGFLDAARLEFGLEVPSDLCVIGFDNIEEASWASYRMTTFAPPVPAIADYVTKLIGMDDTGGETERRRVFEPALVWRNTVRPDSRQ
jgi:DNA-binding LacI/PurR family transcriptional regulator